MEELTYFTPAKLLEVANNPIEAKAGSPDGMVLRVITGSSRAGTRHLASPHHTSGGITN